MAFSAVLALFVLTLAALVFVLRRSAKGARPDEEALSVLSTAIAKLEGARDVRTGADQLAATLTQLADVVVLELWSAEYPLRAFAHRESGREAALVHAAATNAPGRLVPERADAELLQHDDLPPALRAALAGTHAVAAPIGGTRGAYGMLLLARRAQPLRPPVVSEIARRIALAIDQARLTSEAALAENAKSDFLAVMSHELKTPLNIVLGYADLLSIGVPSPLPDGARHHLERLRASARDLLSRIEEILTYARMDVDPAPPVIDRVDLSALVRDTGDAFSALARSNGLELEFQVEDHVTISTDRERAGQIVFNLVANAVRFTRTGRVTLMLKRAPGGGANVIVLDTGVGISPEHLAHVFDPFWQVNRSATRTVGGLGLGLSTARKLARSIGGDVTASAAVGSGSTFTFFVPERDVLKTSTVQLTD